MTVRSAELTVTHFWVCVCVCVWRPTHFSDWWRDCWKKDVVDMLDVGRHGAAAVLRNVRSTRMRDAAWFDDGDDGDKLS